MTHIHWVTWGTVTPEHIDEVNKREVCECDGWVYDLDDTGTPSIFNIIHSTSTLLRIFPILDLNCEEKAEWRKWNWSRSCSARWTPETEKKRSVSRWDCKNRRYTKSLCNLPDVLAIAVIKEIALGGLLLLFIMNRQRERWRQNLYMSVGVMKD